MKRRSDYEAIAIIGVGCRFPGGVRGLRSFWELLTSEVDPIGDVPSNRWDANAHFNADSSAPNRMTIRQGGFLPDSPEEFDAAFFGMTPRDAAGLDPQQRVLLEVTWEAFEDAGLPISTTAGTSVGTYIGGFTLDAMTLQLSESNRVLTSGSTATSVGLAMLSARLSHTFDWRGPCFTVDTACSSSLVALHQACVALARGESGIAVAGGVNVMFNPVTTVLMSKGRFLSPDARCKSFDHRANGYVRSEGAGVVVLKPLSAALRDGNHVHAVVRGSAVNQDGRTPGVTVPSGEAQIAVINRAFQEAGVTPDSVGYFEAHGTGTAVGDPIEAEAIGSVLRDSDRAHWLGSVKSNIGHTEAAAGVAGLIKAVLCVQHGQIPPNLHFERPNPGIRFEELPLRVPTSVVPFPALPGPRRASINSFGFGGTNAHAVIEQAPISPEPERGAFDGSDVPLLLPLSARTPEALAATIKSYEEVFGRSAAPSFREVCRAASRQRDHHAVRTFVVAENSGEAVTGLANLNGARSAHSRERGVAFVYPGMGPQWWGMGRELLEEEPRFRDVVRACDEVLARFGISMAEELARPEHESKLTRTRYAQVANFVVQAGLTAVWRGWGIEPVAIVGHSVGEVAAAYAAGVYSLEDALTISFHRARLQAGLAGMGVMAAAGASEAEIRPHLLGGVEVAAVNSSSTTTLSGDPQVMDVVAERLRDAGVNVQPLRVEVAYHSHQMDGIREQLLSALAAITPSEAVVPLYSTVTGGQVGGEELNAAYWWRNVRQPVRFADAFRRLLAREPGQVLEVGPHPVLATAIDEAIAGSGSSAGRFASLVRNQPQRRQLAETLGALYVAGADPDWSGVYPGALGRVELPAYPWQRERHWLETEESARARLGSGGLALAGRVVAATSPTRDVDLSTGEFPYLEDHKVDGAVVFPGTGYLEVALAGFADETPCVLEDISFDHPLVLGKGSVTTLRVEHDLERRSVLMHSREYGDNVPWTLHVRMRKPQLAKPKTPSVHTESLTRLTARLTEVGQEDIYAHLKNRRLDYGPAFRAVERLWCHNEAGEIYASLRTDTVVPDGHRLHPALLDAALHAMIVGASLLSGEQDDKTYVPERIDTLRFHRSVGQKLWVRGRQRQSGADRLTCDMTLITDDGEVVAELLGVHARALTRDKGEGVAEATPQHYESSWHAADFGDCDDRKGTWIVVGSGLGADSLEQTLTGRQEKVLRVPTSEPSWVDRVVANAGAGKCRGVVFVDSSLQPLESVCDPVAAPLRLVQALPPDSAGLFLITRGAQGVDDEDVTTAPWASASWGFGRVVAAERPELRCRLIDISGEADGEFDALVRELGQDSADEVKLRGSSRYVRRLERADPLSPTRNVLVRTTVTPVGLHSTGSGADGLRFTSIPRREPGPGEVEIEVAYVGVNFKDVLKVSGLLTPEALRNSLSGNFLGLECSGTVVRTGEGVTGLAAGDEVFAHGADMFRSHVTVDARRVVPKPGTLSLAQAASLLPVVTAHHALVRLANVRPGERVLIHSAAGGVGLAAVRIARSLGAQVYATAGSEQRREYLQKEGVQTISDSRSTAFFDDVLAWTEGEGVDVVVNSLSGELLEKSVALLRPFGRFVEIGKADIAADRSLGLAAFGKALSFHAFDYDQMLLMRPEVARGCMLDVSELCVRRSVEPLPVSEVSAGAVREAIKGMTAAGHVGKIVVRMGGEELTVPADSMTDPVVRPQATYLITGGLGGLGLEVARWLALNGATHLVLVGRSGVSTDDARRTVTELTNRGVEVRVEEVDIADRGQVGSLIARTRAESPPLRGIIHGAANFDDVVLPDTTAERLVTATRPKADGAWHLHLATREDALDFFVLFSSLAAQIGAPAAGNYVTANEFLNGLARYRRGLGLPATSVGWGMIDQVGVAVQKDGAVGNALRRNGHIGMTPTQLVSELEVLLRARPTEVSVAAIDWRRWAKANPQIAAAPRFSQLVPDADAVHDDMSLPQRLRDSTRADRLTLLPAQVAPVLHAATGVPLDRLGDEQAVDIDSLVAVELRVRLQDTLGVSVPAVKLQRNLTVGRIVTLLADELERQPIGGARESRISTHEFVSSDGTVVYGHLSLPSGPGPHPAVVVCTSGTGGALDDDGQLTRLSEHAPLTEAGFAVFTVDHRGAPGHGPEFSGMAELGGREVDDVIAAAEYLVADPAVDEKRISILGTSRGGYVALLATTRAPMLWHRCVLLMAFAEPGDLLSRAAFTKRNPVPLPPGTTPIEVEAYFAERSRRPLLDLGVAKSPILLVHGDADEVVPHEEAHRIAERAREAGLDGRLISVAGMGHDHDHAGDEWTELWPEIRRFLRGNPHPAAEAEVP